MTIGSFRIFSLSAAMVAAIQITAMSTKSAAAAPTACGNEVQTYSVRAGDTLSRIAQTAFGDYATWPRIFEYPGNVEAIGNNPDLLLIGTRISIPPCPGSVASGVRNYPGMSLFLSRTFSVQLYLCFLIFTDFA